MLSAGAAAELSVHLRSTPVDNICTASALTAGATTMVMMDRDDKMIYFIFIHERERTTTTVGASSVGKQRSPLEVFRRGTLYAKTRGLSSSCRAFGSGALVLLSKGVSRYSCYVVTSG